MVRFGSPYVTTAEAPAGHHAKSTGPGGVVEAVDYDMKQMTGEKEEDTAFNSHK